MAVKARAEISLVGVSDGAKGATGATGPTGPQGPQGDTGATGNGIKSTTITYQASTSNTTTPSGTWSSSIPSVAAGSYLWTKTVITYTNGTTSTSYSVAKQGDTGPQGPSGAAGANGKMLYGTCATEANTAAKVATATDFKLVSGTSVSIRFTYTNTAASPTLNVNSLGAKAIYTNGTRFAYWAAGATVTFVYDGTNFQVASVPVYANTATVGNPASGNVYIDNDSVDIRNGSTVNSTFTSSLVELGKNSKSSKISMCGGIGTISAETIEGSEAGYDRALTMKSGVLDLQGQSASIGTSSAFYTGEGNEHNAWSQIGLYAVKGENDSHWSTFSMEVGDNNSGNYADIICEANEIFYGSDGTAEPETSGTLQLAVGGESASSGMTVTLNGDRNHKGLACFERMDSNLRMGVGIRGSGQYIYSGLYDLNAKKWLLANNGTDIYLGSSRGDGYIPYYKKGDSITFTDMALVGFITNGSKSLRFSIHLSKPLYGVSSISVSSTDGFMVRQGGKYLYGSSSNVYAKPSSYSGVQNQNNIIRINADFSSTTNVTNNSPAGIQWSGKITFG